MGCILELKVRHIKDWNQLLWVCTCDLVPPVPVPIARMRQKQEGEGHGEDWGGGGLAQGLGRKIVFLWTWRTVGRGMGGGMHLVCVHLYPHAMPDSCPSKTSRRLKGRIVDGIHSKH